MKAKLTLTSPLLRNGIRLNAIAAAVNNSAAELEREIKENIQRSRPAGRTYRRGAIVRKATRRNTGLGLRKRGDRVIVGWNFHRASKAGQPPAIRDGRLINSIRGFRVGPTRSRVVVGVLYGLVLDDPDGLNRPFFQSKAREYEPRFRENIRRAVFG